jgi:valyl-tRNA synthetase
MMQAAVVSEVNDGIAANQLATSVAAIQRFFVQELCDVYIEFSKPVLYGNRLEQGAGFEQEQRARKRSAQATLHRCLDYSMRLLHPFTPFVTEELWQRIREADPLSASSSEQDVETSILCSEYPEESHMKAWIDADAEERMAVGFLLRRFTWPSPARLICSCCSPACHRRDSRNSFAAPHCQGVGAKRSSCGRQVRLPRF